MTLFTGSLNPFTVPPYVPWPIEVCATYGCKNERLYEEREGQGYIRRWCAIHCYLREKKCQQPAKVYSLSGKLI